MNFYREKFTKFRKEFRWSTVGLAKELKVSRPTISKWENGHQVPTVENMYKAAEVFNINVSEFTDLPYSASVTKNDVFNELGSESLNDLMNVDSINPCINDIAAGMKKLQKNLDDTLTIIKTLLFYTNNIIYVKDTEGKYIIANKTALDTLSVKEGFVIKGKKDSDFFSKKEVSIAEKEDREILTTGLPILNKERYISGTRNQRWGTFSKIPIFDKSNKIIGILGVINDITERKKEEEYLKTLEYALSKLEYGIWIGKGINPDKDLPLYRDLLYMSKPSNFLDSSIWKGFFGTRDLKSLSLREYNDIFQAAITEESRKELVKLKQKSKYPVERSYTLLSPVTNKKILIKDSVTFERENERFIGVIRKASVLS